jgi:hypothetical protein
MMALRDHRAPAAVVVLVPPEEIVGVPWHQLSKPALLADRIIRLVEQPSLVSSSFFD